MTSQGLPRLGPEWKARGAGGFVDLQAQSASIRSGNFDGTNSLSDVKGCLGSFSTL